jgi:hypothetical protein
MEKTDQLKKMIDRINYFDKLHHIEILRIIKNDPTITINENKSGVFINLSILPDSIIHEIQTYIEYIDDQENMLTPLEIKKEDIKNTFFIEKQNKDLVV